jgi:hypothetical protein
VRLGVLLHAVAVHRRHLPLAYQCDGFVPAPGSSGDGGFCERCQERVHDVSTMRESELRRLLAAHAGGTVCLSYRTDARGQVLLRPEPAAVRLSVGALATLLAACAGHMGELEIPGSVCRDEDGYAVTCPEWSDAEMLSVPEDHEATPDCESEGEGCPVRSTAPAGEVSTIELAETEGSVSVGMVVSPAITVRPPEVAPVPVPTVRGGPVPGAEPSSARLRANFSIDPYEGLDHVRGIIVVGQVASGRPHFVPTKQLWREWRERRAERKAESERWRAAQRETAKR